MKKDNKLIQSKVNNSISKPLVTSQNREIFVKSNKVTKEMEEPIKVSDSGKMEKKADLSLYLEFMEYYNKNDLENTREVLKKSNINLFLKIHDFSSFERRTRKFKN
jgi:hypothetical protein